MFDIKWIRDNVNLFDEAMKRRGIEPQSDKLLALDDERKATILALNEAQKKRNTLSKQIGIAKANGDDRKAQNLMLKVAELKKEVQRGEEKEREQTKALRDALAVLPNILAKDVPDGEDETDNVEIDNFGERVEFPFRAKQHFELGEALGLMDFEVAAKIAGSRFVVLKGALARLERALGQFMLDVQINENGRTEVNPPLLLHEKAMFGTGQLPKFKEDSFVTTDGRWLLPTSEVPLTNMVRENILSINDLPMRLTGLTPNFRSEAGSSGKDTRGMIRQHQFYKVEMVTIATAQMAEREHEIMLKSAQNILKKLNIPFRTMLLCSGDTGDSMQKTYDLEAWLPGQNTYREISSVSIAGDWQARRMNARYRDENGKVHFVHTLNGSGVAVGRALIAVMENYQQEDGSILIPQALQPYMGGLEIIRAQ